MAVDNYADMLRHAGHDVTVVTYAQGENVAVECETCGEVLVDYDRPVE